MHASVWCESLECVMCQLSSVTAGGCMCVYESHSWFCKPVCVCFQSLEEKEELELRCAQLKGDAKIYRQQNKQTVRQLEEVIREREKVRSLRRRRDKNGRWGRMLVGVNSGRFFRRCHRSQRNMRRHGYSCRRKTSTWSRSESWLSKWTGWSFCCWGHRGRSYSWGHASAESLPTLIRWGAAGGGGILWRWSIDEVITTASVLSVKGAWAARKRRSLQRALLKVSHVMWWDDMG